MNPFESALPSPEDIRAARAYRGWNQEYLGSLVGLSKRAILNIENRKHRPTLENLKKIKNAFFRANIIFQSQGGFIENKSIVQVLTGPDSFIDLMLDIIEVSTPSKSEVLFNGADERRSPEAVITKEKEMCKLGIPSRHIIKEGNTFILGPTEWYRWVPEAFFPSSDVTVVYGDKVAFTTSNKNIINHIVVIKDHLLAKSQRRQFEKFWEIGTPPTHSTEKKRYGLLMD